MRTDRPNILYGKGTKEDPYLLPARVYMKYKDEFPNHAARIMKKVRAGTVILTADPPKEART